MARVPKVARETISRGTRHALEIYQEIIAHIFERLQ